MKRYNTDKVSTIDSTLKHVETDISNACTTITPANANLLAWHTKS